MTEAEIRVRHPGGRQHPGPLVVTEARGEARNGFSRKPSKGTTPANTCISDLTIPEV